MSSNFVMPKQIISGAGALNDAKDVFKKAGKKALIVSGKVMEKVGNVAKVTKILDELSIEYAIYTDITGEPTDVMIEGGLKVYKEENCDFLIGLGGGSPLDSMKAIAALVTNPGKIPDYMGKIITNEVPPIIAIPTTAGTGSEATWFTIITDSEKDIKMLLKGPVLMPDVAIIDYTFTLTSSKSVTAAPGLDALKRIFKYLPIAYNDGSNEEAREQMALAALEAGVVINNSSVTIVHGMSRPIGALFHVPHGMSNAMLMKECFSFALDGAYERFADLGRAIKVAAETDSDKEAAEKFLDAVENICKVCEIPTLEEYGVDREKFFASVDKMADDALASGSPGNTIKDVTKDDVLKIYDALWK